MAMWYGNTGYPTWGSPFLSANWASPSWILPLSQEQHSYYHLLQHDATTGLEGAETHALHNRWSTTVLCHCYSTWARPCHYFSLQSPWRRTWRSHSWCVPRAMQAVWSRGGPGAAHPAIPRGSGNTGSLSMDIFTTTRWCPNLVSPLGPEARAQGASLSMGKTVGPRPQDSYVRVYPHYLPVCRCLAQSHIKVVFQFMTRKSKLYSSSWPESSSCHIYLFIYLFIFNLFYLFYHRLTVNPFSQVLWIFGKSIFSLWQVYL